MKNMFNEKRLPQVEDFLNHLNNEWSDFTNKQLRIKFFNNSRSFTDQAIRILEEKGMIEVDRYVGKSYVDGKFIMSPNRYRLLSGESKVMSEVTFFGEEEARVVRFKYKGIYDVTETFTESDKSIVKKVKEELCGLLDEASFISICCSHNMSKEKAWYFYNKISA